ncbi:hypothetical protein OH799_33390 [Nocardia sp. NBC_00881]|uniref:hypothetical protein n=1 Tax=Nocardia sp. NBC_00881 TaxID=2975995 RepID=UPI00386A908A|nr:hypothetical protein OH799_33390 [Nocardia sp. NBC_00881]
MADMNYDRGTLETLIDQLHTHESTLGVEVDNLKIVAGKLINVVWEGNSSAGDFQAAHDNWINEFSDTRDKLAKMRSAIDDALINAFAADKKVSDSFR